MAEAKPTSFSAVGRSSEVGLAVNRPPAQHRPGSSQNSMPKVKLRPWDGVALVETVLADAQKAVRGPRATAGSSSPRVNPALIEQAAVEETEAKVHEFMTRLAGDVPAAASAPVIAAACTAASRGRTADGSGEHDDDTGDADATSPQNKFAKRGGRLNTSSGAAGGNTSLLALRDSTRQSAKQAKVRPTSSFASPAREKLTSGRGPAVGQYNPRGTVTLRRAPAAKIDGQTRAAYLARERANNALKAKLEANSVHRSHSPTAAEREDGGAPNNSFAMPGRNAPVGTSMASSSPAPQDHSSPAAAGRRRSVSAAVAAKPIAENDGESEQGGAAAAQQRPRVGTPAFLSHTDRFALLGSSRAETPDARGSRSTSKGQQGPAPTWPLPTPGSRPSTAGTFSRLERASAFGGSGVPTTISFVDKTAVLQGGPKCLVAMSRNTGRGSHKGQKLLYEAGDSGAAGCGDASAVDPTRVLSTKTRPPSPASFEHMRARPSTPSAPDRPPLGEKQLDPPRGFVDIGRMVYDGERTLLGDPAASDAKREAPLVPNYDFVLRRAPSPGLRGPERDTGMVAPSSASPQRRAPSTSPALRPASTPARSRAARDVERSGMPEDLHPSLDAVRRRAPSPSMKGTSRDAPIVRTTRDQTPSAVYNVEAPERVSTPDLRRGLSRARRDLRFKAEKPVDAVYDVPPPAPKGGALQFGKYRARRV